MVRIIGFDEPIGPIKDEGEELARRIDQQVRGFVGKLDDDVMDQLDYEEEFATFERFKKRKR